MACCGKRRKLAQKNARFFSDVLRIVGRMPLETDNMEEHLLLKRHKRLHDLYTKVLMKAPPNKKLITKIVARHNLYKNEMLKRNIKHNTEMTKL